MFSGFVTLFPVQHIEYLFLNILCHSRYHATD